MKRNLFIGLSIFMVLICIEVTLFWSKLFIFKQVILFTALVIISNLIISIYIAKNIKKSTKVGISFVVDKWKKILFYLVKWLIIFILSTFIIFVFTILEFPVELVDLLTLVISSIITIIVAWDYINGVYKLQIFLQKGKLEDRKRKPKKTLFFWLEDATIEDGYLYEILKEDAKLDVVHNMYLIKNKIKEHYNNDKTKIRLLKIFIERSLADNFISKLITYISVSLLPVVIGIIFKITLSENKGGIILDVLANFVPTGHIEVEGKEYSFIDQVTAIVNSGTIIILILIVIVYIWKVSTSARQRLKLLDKIIDLIIHEEDKDKI